MNSLETRASVHPSRATRTLGSLILVTAWFAVACGGDTRPSTPKSSTELPANVTDPGAAAEGEIPILVVARRLRAIVQRSGGQFGMIALGDRAKELLGAAIPRGLIIETVPSNQTPDMARVLSRMAESMELPDGAALDMLAVPVSLRALCPKSTRVFSSDDPLRSLFDILNEINRGLRPRRVLWVFDAAGLLNEKCPLDELAISESTLDVSGGLHEVTLKSGFEPHLGIGARTITDEQLAATVADDECSLALPRGDMQGSHLVLYVRRATGGESPVWLQLRDEQADRAPRHSRFPIFTRPGWQRIPLPVPWGQSRIFARFADAVIGETLELRRPGVVFLEQSPWDGERVVYRPKTWRRVGPEGKLRDPEDAVSLTVGEVRCTGALVGETTRFRFEPLPAAGAQLHLAFGAAAKPLPDVKVPIVFSFFMRDGGADRVLFQKEIWSEPGAFAADSSLLGIPAHRSADAEFLVEVTVPAILTGEIGAAVAFAEQLR